MDEWPPQPDEDGEDGPAGDDSRITRGRDRFGEAVGDAWESGPQRDRYPDSML